MGPRGPEAHEGERALDDERPDWLTEALAAVPAWPSTVIPLTARRRRAAAFFLLV